MVFAKELNNTVVTIATNATTKDLAIQPLETVNILPFLTTQTALTTMSALLMMYVSLVPALQELLSLANNQEFANKMEFAIHILEPAIIQANPMELLALQIYVRSQNAG